MSDIIHLLPDSVANQIAAGEVVQRPASVIKELLENAIDAHATQIQVVLKEAGRDLIQVIDNGSGMSVTDARMAFERHATSKIAKADDLFALRTMGFRGEALASIASVAEVELRTRRAEDECGVEIRLSGSKFLSQETISCPVGANFSVRNLFFNIPARRKFLKSNATEMSNIMSEFQHVALAYPQIGFTLTHNDQIMLQLVPGSLRQRISALFAKTVGQQLIPIGVDNDLLTITGFVGLPESARKRGALQYFFVNDRYMRHPYFHKAVMQCYEGIIPEGEQPNYFIYLTVDPATIDVNIHPTKTEIKFENESARWHILMATIREALGKFNVAPAIDFNMEDAPVIPALGEGDIEGESERIVSPRPQFQSSYDPFKHSSNLAHWDSLYQEFASEQPSLPTSQEDDMEGSSVFLPSALSSDSGRGETSSSDLLPSALQGSGQEGLFDEDSRTRYFQLGGRYICTSVKSGLMMIDQHRAHINVLYDTHKTQLQARVGISQRELFSEVITFAVADIPVLESIMPDLRCLGFELENLGGGSFSLNGTPATMGKCDVGELLRGLVETAKAHDGNIGDQLQRDLLLRLSRSEAIPYGQRLREEEMEQLADSLFALSSPNYTPDGKLVLSILSYDELQNRFS